MIHSEHAFEMKYNYFIGVLEVTKIEEQAKILPTPLTKQLSYLPLELKVALNPRRWITINLVEKRVLSPDTRLFIFERFNKEIKLGLPTGQYVIIAAEHHKNLIVRPYTPTHPVTTDQDDGFIHFVIKLYFPTPIYKQGGLMSQYMESMKIGDTIKIRGPDGHITYEGNGNFKIHGNSMHVNRICMVAGGSGITPIYQVTRAVLQEPKNITEISLLFSNHTVDDIILRKELNELAEKYKNFKVWYIVSQKPKTEWKFSVGRINVDLMKEKLFPSNEETIAFVCGPPAMGEATCLGLEEIGFTDDRLIEF